MEKLPVRAVNLQQSFKSN